MDNNNDTRFAKALEAIDAVNIQDPNKTQIEDTEYPNELLYSIRMTGILEEYYPEAEELLILAARGQHIKRWAIAREEYPEGRIGYLQWRKELTRLHCSELSRIMKNSGYNVYEIESVEHMLNKRNLKTNDDSQILQDVVSIVFLKFYAEDFVSKHSDKNIDGILAKMLTKVSKKAVDFAKTVCPAPIVEALSK